MYSDAGGLPITTQSADAAARYNTTIENYLEYRAGAMGALKFCLEADPDFVMANCLRGYLMMLFGSNAMNGRVESCLAKAAEGAAAATPRERSHLAALRAWLDGDWRKSDAIWDAILSSIRPICWRCGCNISTPSGWAAVRRCAMVLPASCRPGTRTCRDTVP